MARTSIEVKFQDAQAADQTAKRILLQNNYSQINENAENVWKCGNGLWTAIKYIKIEYASQDTMIVSGWVRPMGGSEMDLSGFVGALPKKQVLKVIREIQIAIPGV